jgi:hypothetical protein
MITGRVQPHMTLLFQATMKIVGVNPYVLVSPTRARALKPGWKKPMPVLVRVNGEPKKSPWRINMMPTGKGSFFLYLHGQVRKESKTGVGDRVDIEVVFDEKYRGGPATMPAWFRAALKANPRSRAGWESRTPSRQKEILRYLTNLKSQDARERNIEKAMKLLAGEPVKMAGLEARRS